MQQHIGQFDWLDGTTTDAPSCPACGSTSPKTLILETASAIPQDHPVPMRLVSCPECRTRYWTDLSSFHYEEPAGYSWGTRFYVEQGASIDGLIEPIARLPVSTIKSCLEIGCGFGFSLDAGRVLFGWRTLGVDPSPLAKAGRAALDIDIRPIYADADTELGGPFDVVYASEVIEHVADPHGFLRICRAHLAPGGTLILTTPDGDAVRPETPASALMPIVGPGHHLVLFNADSLQQVVRAAGFAFTQIVPREYGLVLYAADQPLTIDGSSTLDRALFRAYLTDALARPNRPADLRAGLRYRLFKELVNAAEHDAALGVYADIAEDCRARFDLDLSRPISTVLDGTIRTGSRTDDFPAPFCLPGLLFFRGIVALNASAEPWEAANWFDAAAQTATAFRTAYQQVGVDDGETGMIERSAPELALLALCRRDGGKAIDRLRTMPDRTDALVETATLTLLDLGMFEHARAAAPLSSDAALDALVRGFAHLVAGDNDKAHDALAGAVGAAGQLGQRARSADILALTAIAPAAAIEMVRQADIPSATRTTAFIRLVDLGHLAQAAAVEPMIEFETDWDLQAHRGMLALLHHNAPAQAAEMFTRIAAQAPAAAAWNLHYHALLAYIAAADAVAARGVASDLLAAHEAVPPDIRTKIDAVLTQHPAARPKHIR